MTDSTEADAGAGQVPLWRKVLPFLLGAALIAWVFSRLDFDAFRQALASTNYAAFIAFTVVWNIALLAADSFATAYVYRTTIAPVRYGDLFVIRAASYLPSMLNHHVGQAWLTYFLSKVYRAPIWRVAGATLLVYATILGTLLLFGIAALPVNRGSMPWLQPTVFTLLVLGIGYLGVLVVKPAMLGRWQATAPLLDAGVKGHLVALAYRIPHMVVQFVGAWVPFLFFGVDVPLGAALALVPPLMVIVALPITPQGVGTRDLFALQLFAAYASGTPEQQQAAVAAATVSWAGAITIVQIGISPIFMRKAYRLLGKLDADAGDAEIEVADPPRSERAEP